MVAGAVRALYAAVSVPTERERERLRRTRRVFVDPYAGVLAPLIVGVPAAALFFGVKDGLGELAAEKGLTDPFLVEAVTVCLANAPYWLARAPIELID